jgi:hypothetical protein
VDLESSVMHKMNGFLETSERPFLEIWTLAGWPILLQLKFGANFVFASYL